MNFTTAQFRIRMIDKKQKKKNLLVYISYYPNLLNKTVLRRLIFSSYKKYLFLLKNAVILCVQAAIT